MNGSFDRLPAELRHNIWQLVLGDGDPATMVPFLTSRPYMLEEEDDDDDMMMGAEDAGEILSEEQFEQIRQLALQQVAVDNENAATGPVAPAPTTLPSNGIVRAVNNEDDQGGNGAASGEAHSQAAVDAARAEIEEQMYNGYDDDDQDIDIDLDDDDAESFDTDVGDFFESGNPYGQERAWDDEVVIPVYAPPLLLINREARHLALRWLAKHNIQLTRNTIAKGEIDSGFVTKPGSLPALVRKYDPARDHLYVDRRYWRRFCDRLQMPHMIRPPSELGDAEDADEEPPEPVHDIGETIQNLALPAFTLYHGVGTVGHMLQFLPNIKQVACIWGDLPGQAWQPEVTYETVQRDGQAKTQVTLLLTPRWDHVRISEKLSQAELDRRQVDTDRINAERDQGRQAKQERRARGEVAADDDEDDNDDDDDDDDDDEDMEDEGTGPLVTMCIRDPTDAESVYYEKGYLSSWLNDIYNELSICELPEHVTDEYDGSVTLSIVPCSAVCPSATQPPAATQPAAGLV